MKKKHSSEGVVNKRARFDYNIERTLVAGIALSGPETKSLRMNHGVLSGAHVVIKDDGAWLINLQVHPIQTNFAHLPEDTRDRSRRLLLKAKEIEELLVEKTNGKQVVATKLLTKGKFIKVELGVGRGMKRYDKRENIKRRDTERIEASRFKR